MYAFLSTKATLILYFITTQVSILLCIISSKTPPQHTYVHPPISNHLMHMNVLAPATVCGSDDWRSYSSSPKEYNTSLLMEDELVTDVGGWSVFLLSQLFLVHVLNHYSNVVHRYHYCHYCRHHQKTKIQMLSLSDETTCLSPLKLDLLLALSLSTNHHHHHYCYPYLLYHILFDAAHTHYLARGTCMGKHSHVEYFGYEHVLCWYAMATKQPPTCFAPT